MGLYLSFHIELDNAQCFNSESKGERSLTIQTCSVIDNGHMQFSKGMH